MSQLRSNQEILLQVPSLVLHLQLPKSLSDMIIKCTTVIFRTDCYRYTVAFSYFLIIGRELEEPLSHGGDAANCRVSSLFVCRATSDVRVLYVAGLQIRADLCSMEHVGLRGKSFSTKMLKEEGESIALNSMCASKRERNRQPEKRKERRE